MQPQYKINDYGFNSSYMHIAETNDTNYTRKPFLGIGKRSFLVFHHNKYITVPTESIAFFYIKYDASIIVTYDKREYSVNYSLEQIQDLLPGQQFFRLNRQYLVNFNAIKEVEHYFARKLLVIPTIPFADKLIVSKEKARTFLDWLENR
jgi:DNA-binding LytR/AlgR family response regulator